MNFLQRLALQEKKLDDSSRLDAVEIVHVPDMLLSLFPSWSGWGLINAPVHSWCPILASLISMTLPQPPSFVLFQETTW